MVKSSEAARMCRPMGVRWRSSISSTSNSIVTPMMTSCSDCSRTRPTMINSPREGHKFTPFGRLP